MNASIPDQVSLLTSARVVCVGDVMLDRFVYGHVTRVSPEAPIPVCRVQNETAMLGGAGNVVRNLVALGAGVGSALAGSQVARMIFSQMSARCSRANTTSPAGSSGPPP